MRRAWAGAALLPALLAIAGCAAVVPVELPPDYVAQHTPRPAAAAPAPVAPSAAPAAAPVSAVAPGAPGDTVPSPAARAVLASIPEPVAAATPPPPARGHANLPPAAAPSVPATAPAPRDTLPAASTPGDSTIAAADTLAIPVPSPTTPLGGGAPVVMKPTPPASDSTRTSVAPPPLPVAPPVVSAPAPAAPRLASPATAASDTCWRLQVGAPTEQARGRELLAASQSQLLLPMVVSREAGRWKVRSRDCMSRSAAESLRDRAVASGFKGVFLVRYVGKRP